MTMETQCCQKKLKFKDTRHKISVPLATSTNVLKKSSKLKNNNQEKTLMGKLWPKIGLRKTQPNVTSKRRDCESSTDIDRQTYDCAMKSERGALARGSDPPSGHSVYKTAGDTRQAPARSLMQTLLGAAV